MSDVTPPIDKESTQGNERQESLISSLYRAAKKHPFTAMTWVATLISSGFSIGFVIEAFKKNKLNHRGFDRANISTALFGTLLAAELMGARMFYATITTITGIATLIIAPFSIAGFIKKKPLDTPVNRGTALFGGLLIVGIAGAKILDTIEKKSDEKKTANFTERVEQEQAAPAQQSR
jgi:uncharacterized metal-binding protein